MLTGERKEAFIKSKKKQFILNILDADCQLNFKQICTKLDIDFDTALKWLYDDNFFYDIMYKFNKTNRYFMLELLKKLNKMASDGDIKAIKLLIDLQGKLSIASDDFEKVVIVDDIRH